MRQIIKGKHLGKVTTIDKKTGKEEPSDAKMFMLPAQAGTCEQCAVTHDPSAPHNAQSLFYQYWFYNEHGRWPDWRDAMAHCSKALQVKWIALLILRGVGVEGGEINPKRKGKG